MNGIERFRLEYRIRRRRLLVVGKERFRELGGRILERRWS